MAVHRRFNYSSLDGIREAVTRAGLDTDIQFDSDVATLGRQVRVGSRVLPNSLAIHPMEGRDSDPEGKPGPLTFRRYERYARGGAGLIWFEASAVWPQGRGSDTQMVFVEGNRTELEGLLAATRRAAASEFGPGHHPVCIAQLQDAGRYRKASGTKPALLVHNPYLDPLAHVAPDHPLMTDDEVGALQDAVVKAAVLAWRIGFDGADVKSCHRYLGSEFLAAHAREGSYGGGFEARTRFLIETVDRIRAEVGPEFLVTTRINLYDAIPYPYGWGVGRDDACTPRPDLSEPIRLAGMLKQGGVRIVSASAGTPYYNPHVTRPFDVPVAGAAVPDEHPLEGVARSFNMVGRLQQAHPDLVVVGGCYTWLRQFCGPAAAANVRRGLVTVAGFGRMAFAYPDFARDLLEKGSLDPRKVCICCSRCSQLMRDGASVGCVVRDREVYRYTQAYEGGEGTA